MTFMKPIDDVTAEIVDAAYRIHVAMGPGLLESVYEIVLARALEKRGLLVERQKAVSFDFDGIHFDEGLRLDMLVESQVVVELKSLESLAPVHAKQLQTYLRLLNLRVGLLINFGQVTLKDGLKRIVNKYDFAQNPSATNRLRINDHPTSKPDTDI